MSIFIVTNKKSFAKNVNIIYGATPLNLAKEYKNQLLIDYLTSI